MKALWLVALATLCFAAESPVSLKSIQAVEGSLNDAFRANTPDPYSIMGLARGTYIDNYGTLFTAEVQLIGVMPPNPFKPVISDQERESLHDRKLKKLSVLRQTMQSQMLNASKVLDGLPLNERVAMEITLFTFTFENSKDMPKRIFMTAEKGKLLEAAGKNADLSTVIQEQDR